MELQHYDRLDYGKCWEYNDQRRNANLDKFFKQEEEADEIRMSDVARAECKKLWEQQRRKILTNASKPMACYKATTKCCYNHHCFNEVNWQWSNVKNFCAGDRCVQQLSGPGWGHKMQMNCIRMELHRYWEAFEMEVEDISPSSPLVSPSSVQDNVDPFTPMDMEEFNLLSDESLIFDLEDLECDELLQ